MPAPSVISADEAAGLAVVSGTAPRRAGDPTAASYLNFLIVNGGVVMPAFDDPHDEPARRLVARAFPDRRVVTVPGREILLGGGNVHCITQQQPRGERQPREPRPRERRRGEPQPREEQPREQQPRDEQSERNDRYQR
jgi:agmatine deiminase